MITFRPHDVEEKPCTQATDDALKVACQAVGLGQTPVACAVDCKTMLMFYKHGILNPLLAAVVDAYAEHHALCLDPDVIWLTIAQGFSIHQRIKDVGRVRETISVDIDVVDVKDWPAAMNVICAEIAAREPVVPLLVPNFSTTTDVSRTAGTIIVMSAFNARYKYELCCVCGIPRLRLLGTPDDWREVRRRADELTAGELPEWHAALMPILDQFVAASEGHQDEKFWAEICQTQATYGSYIIGGWVARLFPYVGGTPYVPNPMVVGWENSPVKKPVNEAAKRDEQGHVIIDMFGECIIEATELDGLHPYLVPRGLASACVTVNRESVGGTRDCYEVIGGTIGVELDEEGFLRPRTGWVVRPIS